MVKDFQGGLMLFSDWRMSLQVFFSGNLFFVKKKLLLASASPEDNDNACVCLPFSLDYVASSFY
jgi:hypothetical protein